MNIFDEPIALDRSEKNAFSSTEEVKDLIESYQEFDCQQIIAEYEAIESARLDSYRLILFSLSPIIKNIFK